jgi:hypothetical protein
MIFTAFAHAFRARKLGWDAYIREWEQAGEEKRKEQEQKKQATTNK